MSPNSRSAFVPHDLTAPIKGAAGGPLAGLTVAVKDMFDIEGYRTGGGSPDWLGQQDTDRNLKLFWASCRLAEGGVPLGDALDAMVTAAQSDFGEREITRTVFSAYRSVGAGARPDRRAASVSGEFARGNVQQRVPATRGLP